jgi:alpha-mannosidase
MNKINRRDFAKYVLAASPQVLRVGAANDKDLLYFVDGYHGGVRGHMPAGAWRDIVNRLESTPEWKLCLDIEPASWVRLAEDDPEAFARIRDLLNASGSPERLEMVAGTFAQPYGWAMTGESNIRQLVRGLEVIRASFPGLAVDTYATQEPCWASCLPQILVSLGFKAAVLKDPSTAWGGYSTGIDAEIFNWVGPDGTAIRTVPRYASEELLDTWRTEAQTGSRAFMEKCIEHGIAHPAGMCFQDLGWAARPNVEGDYIRFVTWREYMEAVAGKTTRNWRFGIEDIRCSLPWGEKTLQKIARQVRSAENRLIAAEKMACLAAVFGKQKFPADELQAAWDKTLWSQHHDCWITATTRTGRDAWAFQVAAETWDAEAACRAIIDRSLDRLSGNSNMTSADEERSFVHVFNTQAHDRQDIVEIELPTDMGTKALRVRDAAGNIVPSQFTITRKYLSDKSDRVRGGRGGVLGPGESIGAVRLLFQARVPATGRVVYDVEGLQNSAEAKRSGATAAALPDGSVVVETDLYRITFDAAHGGAVSSLFAKALNREFCMPGDRRFHEFRGYFIEQKEWQTSATSPATLEILEHGPVRVTIAIHGSVGSVPFRSLISIVQGQRRIEFSTQLRFAKDTWIGDPWEIKPAERMTGRRRSEYDDRFKLLALFPVRLQNQQVYKSAAYDVCRSENKNTFFQSWDTIKHNIIVNWVDLHDETNDVGFALLTDHTTSYAHGEDHPLSLVMGWGWDGGYWWGKCPLNGVQELRYAVIPHAGRWNEAGLWRESTEWSEPLPSRISLVPGKAAFAHLVRTETPGVYLTAALIRGRDLFLRFFNAESNRTNHVISLGIPCDSVELVELDCRRSPAVASTLSQENKARIVLQIPQFGLRTLRLSNAI